MSSTIKSIAAFKAATQRHMNKAMFRNTHPADKKKAEEAFLRNIQMIDKHYETKVLKMIRMRTTGK